MKFSCSAVLAVLAIAPQVLSMPAPDVEERQSLDDTLTMLSSDLTTLQGVVHSGFAALSTSIATTPSGFLAQARLILSVGGSLISITNTIETAVMQITAITSTATTILMSPELGTLGDILTALNSTITSITSSVAQIKGSLAPATKLAVQGELSAVLTATSQLAGPLVNYGTTVVSLANASQVPGTSGLNGILTGVVVTGNSLLISLGATQLLGGFIL